MDLHERIVYDEENSVVTSVETGSEKSGFRDRDRDRDWIAGITGFGIGIGIDWVSFISLAHMRFCSSGFHFTVTECASMRILSTLWALPCANVLSISTTLAHKCKILVSRIAATWSTVLTYHITSINCPRGIIFRYPHLRGNNSRGDWLHDYDSHANPQNLSLSRLLICLYHDVRTTRTCTPRAEIVGPLNFAYCSPTQY